ncbi:MAG: hypothetical protein HKN30_13895 [Sulfitobacter sp.]|nr:hypothetical protein [Sulfitobacter sp.]
MLAALVATAHDAASRTARNAVLGLGAVLCLAVGLGFMTLAAWLFLISVMPPLNAALILGCAYFGISLTILAILSIKKRAYRRARARAALARTNPTSAQSLTEMIAAFMTGVNAGRKARF